MPTSEPYLRIRSLDKRLVLREINSPLRIQPGAYNVRVGDQWVEMYAVENRITTGGAPIRGMELHASGSATEPLVVLEAGLRTGGGLLQMRDSEQNAFEVSFVRLISTLYLSGDFQVESDGDEFQFCVKLSGDKAISGFAIEEDWQDRRALAIRDLDSNDEIALIRAIMGPETIIVERVPWD